MDPKEPALPPNPEDKQNRPSDILGALFKRLDPGYGRKTKLIGFLSAEEVGLHNKWMQQQKKAEAESRKESTYKDLFWATVRVNHSIEGENIKIDDVTQQLFVYED